MMPETSAGEDARTTAGLETGATLQSTSLPPSGHSITVCVRESIRVFPPEPIQQPFVSTSSVSGTCL